MLDNLDFLLIILYFGSIVFVFCRYYQHMAILANMFDELAVETRLGKSCCIAQNDEFHAGTSDGNIHTAQVVEESDATFVISSYHRNQYHVTFLPLEPIHRIDRNVG